METFCSTGMGERSGSNIRSRKLINRCLQSGSGSLVERGDAFFSARDISSARLYYERAAEAGDGQAALRLGASFDPEILERAGARGVAGDPALALSWYRRARALGKPEAERRIKSLEIGLSGETDTRSC